MDEFDSLLKKFESAEKKDGPKEQNKPDILVIDDDESMRRGLKNALTHKYRITTADSGQKGIELLNAAFHCVILDVKMQGMNGFETYPELKKKCPEIPIVFFTAFQSEHDLQAIINKYKPEGYVEKGKDISFLEHLIENAIAKYHLILENEAYKKDLERKVEKRTKQYNIEKEKAQNALKDYQTAVNQLIETERLTAAGRVAFGVGHDLRNLIATTINSAIPIKGLLGDLSVLTGLFLQNKEDDISLFLKKRKIESRSANAITLFETMMKSLNIALTRVKELEGFAREDGSDFEEVDIEAVIEHAFASLRDKLRNIRIDKRYSHNGLKISGNSLKLHDVFENLITNACEALEDLDAPVITLVAEKTDKGLSIIFKDNGPGIPEKIRKHIFDLFFSTKDVKEGRQRGAGLYNVWKRVKEHSGNITVESYESRGTEFTITFPAFF